MRHEGTGDNETFSEWVEGASAWYETVEEQLEDGASNSLAVLSAQAIAQNLLAASYNFQGNSSAVARQNIAIAQTMLQVKQAASPRRMIYAYSGWLCCSLGFGHKVGLQVSFHNAGIESPQWLCVTS